MLSSNVQLIHKPCLDWSSQVSVTLTDKSAEILDVWCIVAEEYGPNDEEMPLLAVIPIAGSPKSTG